MANEVIKKEGGNVIPLNLGEISVDNLTEQQKNDLQYLVAQKKVELAFELKKRQIKLESSTAELEAEITAIARAKKEGIRVAREHDIEAATGSGHMKIKTGWL